MAQFPSLFASTASRNARFRTRRLPAALAIGLALVLLPAAAAQAAVFIVTTTADGNNGACTVSLCTLRDAVIAANANPGSSITLLSNSTPYMLTLTGVNEQAAATGDLDVTTSLTINGGGAASTTIDGNATDRVFELIGAVTLTLNDLTVRNGSTAASSSKSGGGISGGSGTVVLSFSVVSGNNGVTGQGGGIFANNVTLTNSTVSGNTTSDQGGGIFATSVTATNSTISGNQSTGDQGGGLFLINGSSTITNSTISGNSGGDNGGGFYLNGSTNSNLPAILTITNSTISNNTTSTSGGGGMFLLSFATVTITDSTIASNAATSNGANIQNGGAALSLKNTIVSNPVTGTNCGGTAPTDSGTNLQFPGTTCGATITSADPLLQALANNGGPTQTRALGAGSPALNTGTTGCPPVPATDQRGITRPQGSACEIGAFECQTGECGGVGPTATPTLTPTNTPAGVATATPTNTPGVTATPTRTTTPIVGVVVPTLTFPMLALLGLALAGAALLLLKR